MGEIGVQRWVCRGGCVEVGVQRWVCRGGCVKVGVTKCLTFVNRKVRNMFTAFLICSMSG